MKKLIAAVLCAVTLAGAAEAQGWRRNTRIRSLTRDLAVATDSLRDRATRPADRLGDRLRDLVDDRDRGDGLAARLDEEAERLHSRARDLDHGRIDRFERGDRFARERMDRTDRRERELAFIEQFRIVERTADRLDRRLDRGFARRGAERIFRNEIRPLLSQLRAELPTLTAWRDFHERRTVDRERM